jgi:hypothetical protein
MASPDIGAYFPKRAANKRALAMTTTATLAKDSGDLRYTPLGSKQIRLLTIHSGPKDSDIECTLSISSFPPPLDSPSYHALSYT